MFDLGWSELLVIGIVALIVIGPKDLPDLFRTLGKFTAKVRMMARDFQRAMEDAADNAGVKDVTKDLRDVTNPKKMGLDALNKATDDLKNWEPPETSSTTPEPAEMTEERKATAERIQDAMAKKALDRQTEEAAAAAVEDEATYAAPEDPRKTEE